MVAGPNLFVIGAPRCGTTSLYAALKQHPEVYASVLKEPHYYAGDLPAQPHTVSDRDDYLRFFEGADGHAYRAEASVWYLYSERAPAEIARDCPEARIVLLLRDPTRMLVSLYGLYLRTGNEAETDPDVALSRTEAARFPGSYFPFGLHYLRLLDIAGPLRRWRSFFPTARIRVLFHEEFYQAPEEHFRSLCRWLDVDAEPPVSFDPRLARERVRAQALVQMRRLPERLRRKMNPAATRLHAGTTAVTLSERTRRRLRDTARELNADLADLCGRPLPSAWSL